MWRIEPVGGVGPVTHVRDASRAPAARGRSDVHPFWQALNERVLGLAGDEARFELLADVALHGGAVPALVGDAPPAALLRLHEEEVRAWARAQPPDVRGRLARLMQGANVAAPWPHHLLQREGRFSTRWRHAMCSAARAYVRAVAADALAMAPLLALAGGAQALGLLERQALAARLTAHAAAAWGVPAPHVLVHDRGRSLAEGEQAAQTLFGSPPTVAFYPLAFDDGTIELLATVFHEVLHCLQMGRVRLEQDDDAGGSWGSAFVDEWHAQVLALSFDHARVRHLQRGDRYYLYRYATEIEREAHLAGLQVALVAADLGEFGCARSGTLARIARGAGTPALREDPHAAVLELVRDETALHIGDVGAAAERAGSAGALAPTLHALAARAQGSAAPFDGAAFERLLAAAAATSSAEVERAWQALVRLQTLRDPHDRSGLVAQAIVSAAPEVFFGGSDESEFLHAIVNGALNAAAPPLLEHAWALLARRFARGRVPPPQALRVLQAAWYAYRSRLSRRILLALVRDIGPLGPSGTAKGAKPLNLR